MNITALTTEVISYNETNDLMQYKTNSSDDDDIVVVICEKYIGPALCAFGIMGNILNLVVLFRGLLNEPPYLYLKALAFADTLALVLSLFHMTLSSKSDLFGWKIFDAYVFFPFVNFFIASSVWLTVGVTIDRFAFVKAPLWARAQSSLKKAKTRIIIIILLTLFITTPRFFCFRIQQLGVSDRYGILPTPFRASSQYRIYDIVCIALFHLTPLIIFIIANVYLILAVERARGVRKEFNIRNNKESDWQVEQRRLTITLISIVMLSIIAIFPSTIGDFTKILSISFSSYRRLRHISNLLLLCNLSMNFLLYCAFNKRFVRSLKFTFGGSYIKVKDSFRKTRSVRFSRSETNVF